jgi:hypothetical protein
MHACICRTCWCINTHVYMFVYVWTHACTCILSLTNTCMHLQDLLDKQRAYAAQDAVRWKAECEDAKKALKALKQGIYIHTYVCACIYMSSHMHAYIQRHGYPSTCINIYVQTCMHTCTDRCMHTCVQIRCMHTCVQIRCMHTCVQIRCSNAWISIYMYKYIRTCMHTYMYGQMHAYVARLKYISAELYA